MAPECVYEQIFKIAKTLGPRIEHNLILRYPADISRTRDISFTAFLVDEFLSVGELELYSLTARANTHPASGDGYHCTIRLFMYSAAPAPFAI